MNTTASPLPLADTDLLRTRCPIGGQWLDADSGAACEVANPATGAVLGTVPDMGAAETRRAIAAAHAAFPAWSKKTAKERAQVLRRLYQLMMEHQDDLALLMTAEQGKPLAEAKGEVAYSASFIEWFGEEAKRMYGETIPGHAADKRIMVLRQPVGVVAAITPWNFPSAMLGRKLGPALAAGCTVVCKPALQTPYSALALAVLAERAGIPPGVINIVTGRPEAIGAELTGNEAVRKLSFTGSTRVGALLMAQCAGSVKRLSLELGGNAPLIVFDDADLEAAVEGAMVSKFRNGGQTCVCANRILVQEGIYDAFAAALSERVGRLRVGDGLAGAVDVGPMINSAALDKIDRHLRDALEKGARRLTPERAVPPGRFVAPVVLGDAGTDMALAQEETFGPVAPLFRFSSEAEALAIANGTPFGLAAYFYTRDLARAFRVGEALEFGMVGLNTGLISTEVAPFGGIKQSGLGREGARAGIEEYLELKSFHMAGL